MMVQLLRQRSTTPNGRRLVERMSLWLSTTAWIPACATGEEAGQILLAQEHKTA